MTERINLTMKKWTKCNQNNTKHTLREETLTHNTLNCMVCLKSIRSI